MPVDRCSLQQALGDGIVQCSWNGAGGWGCSGSVRATQALVGWGRSSRPQTMDRAAHVAVQL